jgi:hypothetical protein
MNQPDRANRIGLEVDINLKDYRITFIASQNRHPLFAARATDIERKLMWINNGSNIPNCH